MAFIFNEFPACQLYECNQHEYSDKLLSKVIDSLKDVSLIPL